MIKVGDALPKATFTVMSANGPVTRTTDEIFAGKKVVLFAVPGAFTPTCSNNHLPGFLEHMAEFAGKGVDTVAVTGVNDVHVMNAWALSSGGKDKIEFLADGSGQFAKAIGLDIDLSDRGMGIRSRRYSMLVDNGIVRQLNLEAAAGVEVSGADFMLKHI